MAVSGGSVSAGAPVTVQVSSAGVGSVNPSAVPRTAKVCSPSTRPVRVRGEVHAAHGPSSSTHSNVVPDHAAGELEGGRRPDRLRRRGRRQRRLRSGEVGPGDRGRRPTLPTRSVARTETVCGPAASTVTWWGEVHASKADASSGALEGRERVVRGEPRGDGGGRRGGREGRDGHGRRDGVRGVREVERRGGRVDVVLGVDRPHVEGVGAGRQRLGQVGVGVGPRARALAERGVGRVVEAALERQPLGRGDVVGALRTRRWQSPSGRRAHP